MNSITVTRQPPRPVISITAPPIEGDGSNITFYTNTSEMLKITPDGFYVRGKKLDVNDDEARAVYNAFRQFLIWSALVKE